MADAKITIGETIQVAELSEKLDVSAAELVGTLMKAGVMATLNDVIDFDTAAIVASEFEIELEQEEKVDKFTALKSSRELTDAAEARPPVVAVMGHVDHGKTTLLDSIREQDVASGEAGGITQHISAYQVTYNDRVITFLDTPGHEAFSALREHGAALTDVAVIVVAANDGVMPQTKEAVEYAQRAGVRIVVAINKIDIDGADSNQVKTQLSELNLVPEEWGGDTVMVEVSALKKKNIDELLDMVLLVADVDELKAETDVPAEGIVIESHMEQGMGPVATTLVEHGVLKVGQFMVAGSTYAKIRSLQDSNGDNIEQAGPSTPAVISGFKDIPVFGRRFEVVENEKVARKISAAAHSELKQESTSIVKSASEGDVLAQLDATKGSRMLNVVLRADVQGSLESLIKSLEDLGNDEVSVKVVSSGVGDISESDISAAEASAAVIYGFNVGASSSVKRLAARTDGVELQVYKVIYELLDDATDRLENMIEPETIETEVGVLKIKGVFRTTKSSTICGGEVIDGKIVADGKVRAMRGDDVLAEAQITSLQRGKDAAKEVFKGDMCGMELKTGDKLNLKEGDKLVCLQFEQTTKTLK